MTKITERNESSSLLTVDKALLEQALEALSDCRHGCEEPHKTASAVTALRAALAEPAVKIPGMAVQALAGEIIAALVSDEEDGGYDLTSGIFGAAFSALVRRWAAAEWAVMAKPVVEPVAHATVRPLQPDECEPKVLVKWVSRPVAGPLYTSPPPPAEVPLLTPDEVALMWVSESFDTMSYESCYTRGVKRGEQAVRRNAGLK